MKIRLIALILVFALLCSCGGQGGENTSSSSSNLSELLYDDISLAALSAWSKKEMLSYKEDVKTPSVLTDIQIDNNDGNNVYIATMDNGVYISRDGGISFENSSAGLLSSAVQLITIDPNNNNYVLALSMDDYEETNGVYASSNAGRGWKKISDSFTKIPNTKMQLLFDDASYDSAKSNSSIVYLTGVTKKGDVAPKGHSILYRSTDGGRTFSVASHIRPDSEIAVHPTRGYVYLTDSTGFYRSIDHGVTFEMMTGESCTHVFVSPKTPDNVVLAGINGMIVSKNNGVSFENTAGVVPNMSVAEIFASPLSNANFMSSFKNYDSKYEIKYSVDGGVSWQFSQFEEPIQNAVQDYVVDFSFSTKNTSHVMMLYKNAIYKSTDSGATFTICADLLGEINITSDVCENQSEFGYLSLVVGKDKVAYSLYNGASWKLINVKNLSETEYIKSTYLMDKKTLMVMIGNIEKPEYTLAFLSTSNNQITRSTLDKIKTPNLFGDANNKNTLFAGNFYSTDFGEHWEEMNGCDAVLYQNLVSPGEMFGVKGTKVVTSVDKGRNWFELCDVGSTVLDVAFDYYDKALYIVTGDKFFSCTFDGKLKNLTSKIPNNSLTKKVLNDVEVDYLYPNIIYVGGREEEYINDCSIMISIDKGESWRVISATPVNSANSDNAIPLQPFCLRVEPASRVLTAYCGSFGTFEFDITKTQWGK